MQQIPISPRFMNEELEEILQNLGGLFCINDDDNDWVKSLINAVTKRFSHHLKYAERDLYKDKPRPIEFGITNESELNAFAYASPDGSLPKFDFIGINVGAIFTLSDIFQRILAHPDTFPDVGNPKLEVADIHSFKPLTTNVIESNFEEIIPNCAIRGLFASELTMFALDFLFFHELTHLRNGHLEFLRNHLSEVFWQEAVTSTPYSQRPEIRQVLELDADCGAIPHALNLAFRYKSMLASLQESASHDEIEAMNSAYGSVESATRMVTFSSYIFFRLFDITEFSWNDQPDLTHPAPPLRMFLIGPTLYEIFTQRSEYGYDAEIFVRDHSITVRAAEIACGLIQGKAPDLRGLANVLIEQKYLSYINDFGTSWSKIRPTLELFKRGGVLPK